MTDDADTSRTFLADLERATTVAHALLIVSIGGALGVAWAWWDEKKKERKT